MRKPPTKLEATIITWLLVAQIVALVVTFVMLAEIILRVTE